MTPQALAIDRPQRNRPAPLRRSGWRSFSLRPVALGTRVTLGVSSVVFPSLYCSEVSSSLFEVSYNNTQPYALISGYALGRHIKVNGGIPDGWQFGYSTALRFQIDSALHTQVVYEDNYTCYSCVLRSTI